MINIVSRCATILAATTLLAGGLAGAASAQSTSNRVASKTDWSVFVENNPKECWAVSSPKSSVNTKDGKATDVRRGDILLFVTYRPGKAAEVSFMGGYPFAPGSTVDVRTNNNETFKLVTSGEGAWTSSADDDAKMVTALKGGADVTLTAHSSRGTQTVDKFSLMGFTAAMNEAASRCK